MEEIFSSNWKNLTMEKYDGTTDLDDHVDVYITQECNALKDKIKELIKLAYLKEFVHKPQPYRLESS
ncbi:hypothetical protein JHK82_024739 [Glycine max]|nr:hypothetical protein JHK85_025340 [Glycine max]KAG5012595.1 hypothetical protein JHK86_024856 [Glycine max]KAG5133551.1 hypothetical protein JHK82_024739 [Glycine max]